MKRNRIPKAVVFTIVFLVVLAVGIILVWPVVFRPLGPHHMSESINNARQVKYALDTFAMDNDGVYPGAATAGSYECPVDGSSNALFRQLFAGGYTNSEAIFWMRNAEICAKKRPDGITTLHGEFAVSETLQAGDNAWSYHEGMNNIANPAYPLVFGPIRPDHSGYQAELYDGRIIVLRIDSSAKPERMRPHGTVPDREGVDILTGLDPGPDDKPILRHPSPRPR